MRILFFAHDRGGGNVLVKVAQHIGRRAHACLCIGLGPSKDIFAHTGIAGVQITERTLERELMKRIRRFRPDIIVTGTSVRSYAEHVLWRVAGSLNVPSLALVDGWTRIGERFRSRRGRRAAPDRYGVVDSHTKRTLVRTCKVAPARIDVIGHPHLEKSSADLILARMTRSKSDCLTLGFFSTPAEDAEAGPGIDAARSVLPHLHAYAPMQVFFKPHPREELGPWRQWIQENHAREESRCVRLTLVDGQSTHDILASVDLVVGLPTTVLIEAALAGIPAMVIEPKWWPSSNYAIKCQLSESVVREKDCIPQKLSELVERTRTSIPGVVDRSVANSCYRAVKAIRNFYNLTSRV